METPQVVIDTGPQGCGELIMTVARQFRQMEPGQVAAVISHDLGARADIPAWCRLTGHTLLGQEPDGPATRFLIRKGGGT